MDKRLKQLWKLVLVVGGGLILQQLLKRQQSSSQPQPMTPPPSQEPTLRVMSNIVLPPEAFLHEDNGTYTNGAHIQADNLTELPNLGHDAVEALSHMGITRFVELANADAMDLYRELADLPATYEQIEHWIQAAKERVTS